MKTHPEPGMSRTLSTPLLASTPRRQIDRPNQTQYLLDQCGSIPASAAFGAGIAIAVACNLMNNLPVGLIAGSVVATGQFPPEVTGAMAIGVNLGPNLSITGSLATILWLVALRREGQDVSAWGFLRLGLVVAPPALLLSIGTASVTNTSLIQGGVGIEGLSAVVSISNAGTITGTQAYGVWLKEVSEASRFASSELRANRDNSSQTPAPVKRRMAYLTPAIPLTLTLALLPVCCNGGR